MKTLKSELRQAERHLTDGDPDLAIKAIERALKHPMTLGNRKMLERAASEADIGSVEQAENLIGFVNPEDRSEAMSYPQKPFPKFKFKGNKKVGGIPNHERAYRGSEMAMIALDAKDNDVRTNIADALSDIFHWCDSQQIDVDDVIQSAKMNWEAER